MPAARLVILLGSALCTAPGSSPNAFGTWKMNSIRSTLTGDAEAKDLTMRFEPHAKGEVFTLDRTGRDGRITTLSTVLYLDGNPRDFEDHECLGTQSSRRVDRQTIEILRTCAKGGWTRFIRRPGGQPKELIIEITEQHSGGRRFERRLVLEKQ
jgi:hypothetical protein